MATLNRCLIALNGVQGPKWYQAGDGSTKPSYLVMEDDADEVKVCSTSGTPIGVAAARGDQDLNTVYTSGERIPVYWKGSGVEIMVLWDGVAPISLKKYESQLERSATTAGSVTIRASYSIPTSTTAVAGASWAETEYRDTYVIGRAGQTLTLTSGTTKYIRCLLV